MTLRDALEGIDQALLIDACILQFAPAPEFRTSARRPAAQHDAANACFPLYTASRPTCSAGPTTTEIAKLGVIVPPREGQYSFRVWMTPNQFASGAILAEISKLRHSRPPYKRLELVRGWRTVTITVLGWKQAVREDQAWLCCVRVRSLLQLQPSTFEQIDCHARRVMTSAVQPRTRHVGRNSVSNCLRLPRMQ